MCNDQIIPLHTGDSKRHFRGEYVEQASVLERFADALAEIWAIEYTTKCFQNSHNFENRKKNVFRSSYIVKCVLIDDGGLLCSPLDRDAHFSQFCFGRGWIQ
jgi:hypothetical protein